MNDDTYIKKPSIVSTDLDQRPEYLQSSVNSPIKEQFKRGDVYNNILRINDILDVTIPVTAAVPDPFFPEIVTPGSGNAILQYNSVLQNTPLLKLIIEPSDDIFNSAMGNFPVLISMRWSSTNILIDVSNNDREYSYHVKLKILVLELLTKYNLD